MSLGAILGRRELIMILSQETYSVQQYLYDLRDVREVNTDV